MEQVRKYLGLLVLLFIGIPALYSVTWTVGITRAVTRPDFLPELPARISEHLPRTVDLLLEAANQPGALKDENTRAWLLAAAEVRTTPGELLEEIGLLKWLREDLSYTFRSVFEVLKGGYHPGAIDLDLRPLKQAIAHDAIDRYFLDMVNNLPPCTPQQQAAWEAIGKGRRYYGKGYRGGLPAGRPDDSTVRHIAKELRRSRRVDMPDEVTLYCGEEWEPLGLDVLSLALVISFALFLIPAGFIAVGAFIAEPLSLRAFMWGGVSIIVGGIAVLASAFLPKLILKGTMTLVSWVGARSAESLYWPPELMGEITDRIYGMTLMVIDPLFSPVIYTALFVILFGAVCYAVYLVSDRSISDSPEPLVYQKDQEG